MSQSFSELFAYAIGPLVVNAGWSNFVTNNPAVSASGTVVGVAGVAARAYNTTLVAGIDWTQPWSIQLSYEYSGGPPTNEAVWLVGGAIEVAGKTWTAKLNIVGTAFVWTGPDGTTSTQSFTSFPTGVQTWTLSYDGAGTITCHNGAQTVTAPSGSLAGSAFAGLGFEIDSHASNGFPKVHGLSGTFTTLANTRISAGNQAMMDLLLT